MPDTAKIRRFNVHDLYKANWEREDRSQSENDETTAPSIDADNQNTLLSLPLRGGIARLGEYYVRTIIYGQTLRLQVDTGSSSLIVAGESCRNCTSRTFLKWDKNDAVPCDGKICYQCFPGTSGCGFHLKYGDDSPLYNLEATGVIVKTPVSFKNGPTNSDKSFIYVIQREVGIWPQKVDGILGFAFERLNCNPTCFPPAWKALVPEGSTGFSLCMGDRGGKLAFYKKGMKRVLGENRVTLNIIGDPKSYYAVRCRGLAIQTNENHFQLFEYIPIEEIRTKTFAIVDSGTTLLIVPENTWNALVTHFQTNYCHLPGVCDYETIFDRPSENEAICITDPPYKSFPTLALVLGDAVVRIPPSLYFIQYETNIFCLGIQPGPILIVGDAVLRGFTVGHEDDSITISESKEDDCGAVAGFKPGDQQLILDKNFRVSYVRHDIPFFSTFKRLVSLFILLFVMILLLQAWRRYMRRRLYSDI